MSNETALVCQNEFVQIHNTAYRFAPIESSDDLAARIIEVVGDGKMIDAALIEKIGSYTKRYVRVSDPVTNFLQQRIGKKVTWMGFPYKRTSDGK